MGTYNTCTIEDTCPRCGFFGDINYDLYFGDTRCMTSVSLNDPYPGMEQETGIFRSPNRDVYAECPRCKKDWFAIAEVNKGRLVRIDVDRHTAPYMPAQTVTEHVTCRECGPNLGSVILFGKIPVRRCYCGSCDHFWEEPLVRPS